MKQNLTTFFYLLIFHSAFGQLNYNELLPMRSKGTMPEKLKKSYYFAQYENSQTPYLTIGRTTAIERQMIYESIIRSGLPVYGEECNTFCTEILRKITTLQGKSTGTYFIYPIKSDFVGSLNDEKSTIYISTHLIARMKHVEELYFHIARQVYLLNKSSQPKRFKLNRIFNYKKRFELLATYPDSTNRNADNFAIGILNKMGLSIHGAQDGLKNLLDPNIVPEDFPITTSDFCYDFKVSENLINQSTYRYDKQAKVYLEGTQEYYLNKRLLELQKLENSGNEINTNEEENSFQEIKNLCVMQSIEDLLIASNPEKALYYCLVMKKKGIQTGYLAVMEALCWETLYSEKPRFHLNYYNLKMNFTIQHQERFF